MKFKVGDRVAFYHGPFGRRIGIIKKLHHGNEADIVVGASTSSCTYNLKQCRRLVKKERRRLWFNFYPMEHTASISQTSIEGWLEFVEVIKK